MSLPREVKVLLVVGLLIAGAIVVAVGGFVAWRLWATYAGGVRAYAELTDRIGPVERRLAAGQDPDPADVLRFAQDRVTRRILYDTLERHRRRSCFRASMRRPRRWRKRISSCGSVIPTSWRLRQTRWS